MRAEDIVLHDMEEHDTHVTLSIIKTSMVEGCGSVAETLRSILASKYGDPSPQLLEVFGGTFVFTGMF